jgi:hypothetical protein
MVVDQFGFHLADPLDVNNSAGVMSEPVYDSITVNERASRAFPLRIIGPAAMMQKFLDAEARSDVSIARNPAVLSFRRDAEITTLPFIAVNSNIE